MKNIKILATLCLLAFAQSIHAQWNTAGGNPGAGIWLGTNDITPLDIRTNKLTRLYLDANGRLGINTSQPVGFLHVDGKVVTGSGMANFTVRCSSCSSGTYAFTNTELSGLTRVTGIGGNQFTALYVKSGSNSQTGAAYFDGRVAFANGPVGIGTSSPYKMLTVNGDVCFSNYNNSGAGSSADGFSGLEILGNNQTPARRGISLDSDPNGSLNFYINSNQNPSAFNFKNGNGGATLMTINGVNGNIGIGVTAPAQALDVNGNVSINNHNLLLHFSNDPNDGLRYSGSTSPFAGNPNIDGPAIYGFGGGVLGTKNQGGNTENIALIWDKNGNVGIGTDLSSNSYNNIGNYYKLSVNGFVRAKKVVVETGWSDFVFNKDYPLRPLAAVEKHITENGYLPEMPSASEIESNGADVGALLKLQMQKIEELTLYLIEQDKKIKAMQIELDELKAKN